MCPVFEWLFLVLVLGGGWCVRSLFEWYVFVSNFCGRNLVEVSSELLFGLVSLGLFLCVSVIAPDMTFAVDWASTIDLVSPWSVRFLTSWTESALRIFFFFLFGLVSGSFLI